MCDLWFICDLYIEDQISRDVAWFALGDESIIASHEHEVFFGDGAHLRNDCKAHVAELVIWRAFFKKLFGVLGNLSVSVNSFTGLDGVDLFEGFGVKIVNLANWVTLLQKVHDGFLN